MKRNAERVASNREHHLTFYKQEYENMRHNVTVDIFNLAKITKRFKDTHQRMKIIDTNRRQHAADMGVSIQESDSVYDFEALMRSIPKLVEEMKEYEKKYGVDFTTIR